MRYLETTKDYRLVEQDTELKAHRFLHTAKSRWATLDNYFNAMENAYKTVEWINNATGEIMYE